MPGLHSSQSLDEGTRRRRRSRFRRDPQPNSLTRIQRRDIEILRSLYDYRFLTTSQVESLFFNTRKRAERGLRKLYDAGLVDRLFRPVVLGSAEIIYALGGYGVNLLAQEMGIDRGEINAMRLKAHSQKSLFLDHFVDINQFRVALTLSSAASGYIVLFWKYENELRSLNDQGVLISDRVKDPENPGQRIPVSPDGFFGIETPRGRAYFFIEVDRATMSNARFKRKMTGYARYWLDSVYQERWGYRTFRVLTITSANRLANLLKVTGQIKDKQLLPIFYFSDMKSISKETLFSEIWLSPNDETAKSIV